MAKFKKPTHKQSVDAAMAGPTPAPLAKVHPGTHPSLVSITVPVPPPAAPVVPVMLTPPEDPALLPFVDETPNLITPEEAADFRALLAEKARRQIEALNLFRPLPLQQQFLADMTRGRILRGSNRCLAGEQKLYDPVAGVYRRVDEIDGEFHVWSVDPKDGSRHVKRACRPFVKGYGELWEYALSSGEKIRTTPHHRVLSVAGTWVAIGEAAETSARLLCLPASVAIQTGHVRTGRGRVEDLPACYPGDPRCCGEPPPLGAGRVRSSAASYSDAQGCDPCPSRSEGGHSHPSLSRDRPSSCASTHPQGRLGIGSECRDGAASPEGRLCLCESEPQARCSHASHQGRVCEEDPGQSKAADAEFSESHPLQFSLKQDIESAVITGATSLGQGKIWDISVEDWSNYECSGLLNANSGKTLTTCVEVARAVTGRCPFGKYPLKDGRCYIVGKDQKHLGEVMYRKLFRAGAFRIIRDPETRMWRVYDPLDPADVERKALSRPAPPLIPPRFVKSVSWEKKSDNIPSKAILTTGWEIDFFSGNGKPPRGADLDLVCFDEEIPDSDWYPEMSARLIDRGGRFIWGATPQTGSDRLYELHLRAEREAEDFRKGTGPKPLLTETVILMTENRYLPDEDRRAMIADMDDKEYDVRVLAEFAIASAKVWPEFMEGLHVCEWFDIPDDWLRGAIIDPGRAVCAVLFAAVPPDDHYGARACVLYDELYIQNCDAEQFGEKMALKCGTGSQLDWFIIDRHGSRITEAGRGLTVEKQYSEALKKFQVASRLTGHGFIWGSDDVDAGVERVRTWLKVRSIGGTRLRVMRDKCPNFLWEIARYRYKRVANVVTERPEDRGRVHLMACVRYLALHDPSWSPRDGRKRGGRPTGAYAAFLKGAAMKKRAKGGKPSSSVTLGPPRE